MDKETKIKTMLSSPSKVVGSKQVLKGISNGTIRCVIVALDADTAVKRALVDKAKAARVEILYVQSKKRLGEAVGVDVASACVGIINVEG